MAESIPEWRQYQKTVADFFKSIGADSQTDVTISGARGVHNIDVLVTFNLWGQSIVWACECKFWRSSIPKEKILTFYQIVQDIGADRGFLFSENGFQSGALRATNNTNIILTSLADMEETGKDEFYQSSLVRFLRKINFLKSLEKETWLDDQLLPNPLKGINMADATFIDGTLLYLSLSVQKAIENSFPIRFGTLKGQTKSCNSQDEFLHALCTELNEIEVKVQELQTIAHGTKAEISFIREQYIVSVQQLLVTGENALYSKGASDSEKFRLNVLTRMQEVEKNADLLKEIARGTLLIRLNEMMRLLIDTIYLHLTYNTVEVELWNDSKSKVLSKLESLKEWTAL